jgi:DedD protein
VNRYLDDDPDLPARPSNQRLPKDAPEREISLGTTTILGIFFALALGAAAIFGLGYTLGRKSAQSATVAPDSSTTEPSIFSSPKPAAGSQAIAPSAQPAAETTTAPASSTPAQSAAAPAATDAPTSTVTVPLAPAKNAATPADGMIAGDKPPATAAQAAAANPQPATSFVVQVAAVSSQDVADILLASLQKKGYSVAAHREPDNLLHVQIGPFTTRAGAEAIRQRVLADGFNAIVK